MAQETIALVRQLVRASLGAEAADEVRILYGGSVGPNNIDELMGQADIDGALVGGASLQLASFARIVQFER
jgi:triosephosphate isomerase (TIM)